MKISKALLSMENYRQWVRESNQILKREKAKSPCDARCDWDCWSLFCTDADCDQKIDTICDEFHQPYHDRMEWEQSEEYQKLLMTYIRMAEGK